MQKGAKKLNKKEDLHYGWIVSIGCSVVLFYSLGLVINSFSIFLQPITDSLNLSKANASSILSVQNIAGVITMIGCGRIYKHFQVRLVSFLCGLLIVGGYLFFSVAHSLYGCYLSAILVGIGWGGGSMIPVSILLTKWFDDSMGVALGLATAGSGIATMLYPPILTQVIIRHGVSFAFIFHATIIAVLVIVAHLLIRNKPEDKNVLPYKNEKIFKDKNCNTLIEKSLPLKIVDFRYHDAKKTIYFNKMILVSFLIGFSVQSVITHFTALLISFHYNPVYAGYMVSFFGIFMIIGKIIYGLVIDHYGTVKSNIYIFTLWSLALLAGYLMQFGGLIAVFFAILLGLGSPIGTIGIPVWSGELFGRQDYAQFYTTFKVSFNLGASVGILLPGVVADYTGSYTAVFLLYILCTLIAFYILQELYSVKTHKSSKKLL